jgi:hypothetical protein
MSQDSIKTSLVEVMQTIAKDEFTAAFWQFFRAATNAFSSAMTSLRKVEK